MNVEMWSLRSRLLMKRSHALRSICRRLTVLYIMHASHQSAAVSYMRDNQALRKQLFGCVEPVGSEMFSTVCYVDAS